MILLPAIAFFWFYKATVLGDWLTKRDSQVLKNTANTTVVLLSFIYFSIFPLCVAGRGNLLYCILATKE